MLLRHAYLRLFRFSAAAAADASAIILIFMPPRFICYATPLRYLSLPDVSDVIRHTPAPPLLPCRHAASADYLHTLTLIRH